MSWIYLFDLVSSPHPGKDHTWNYWEKHSCCGQMVAGSSADATTSIHRVAICFGVPLGKITSSQNEHLLKILKVAVTLTSWLSNLLKTSKNMTSIVSALALCKHQIGILASLSPLTLSSSINIFFAYRILQTRMMMLYVQHHPPGNGKLVAILRGATCTRHLWNYIAGTSTVFSKLFWTFSFGSTEDHTLGREHTRYRKFKQVSGGQFVLSELAIRFWSHSHNFFLVVTSSSLYTQGQSLGTWTRINTIMAAQAEFTSLFRSFSCHAKESFLRFPIRTLDSLESLPFGGKNDKGQLERRWVIFSMPLCFRIGSACGHFFRTLAPTLDEDMNKLNTFVARLSAWKAAMH